MVFRTALPFGYLAFAMVLLGIAVAGLFLVASGVRRRSIKRGFAGLALLAGSLAVTAINVFAEEGTDLNPRIAGDSALIGVRTTMHAALDLRSRGLYNCRGAGCEEVGQSGRWQRVGDFELQLIPDSSSVTKASPTLRMRVIDRRGRLQLTHTFDDPDLWDGRAAFELVAPAV